MKSEILAEKICKILSDKKGENVVTVNVSSKTSVADYFVIATGGSITQVKSLCDILEEELEKEGVVAIRKEGFKEGRWACLDYGEVIVHIFNDESRLFYHLETLWGDQDNIKKYEG